MENIIDTLDSYTFTGSAIIIVFLLVNELTEEEQDSIGNWLQLVGLVIPTYASQVTMNQSVQNNNNDIENLTQEINDIKKELEEIKKGK